MMNIRASRMDLNAACAPSAQAQNWTIGGDRYAGDLGSAGHEIWTGGISGVYVDLNICAQKWQVDPDELQQVMNWCSRHWDGTKDHPGLKRFFSPARTEVGLEYALPDVRLTGHLDVLHQNGPEARICDGKSGRLDGDHDNQLRAYAWLVCANYPEIEKVRVCIFRWRLQKADWETYTREELGRWWSWFQRHLQDQTIFRPDVKHCGWCPRRLTCDAHRELLTKIGTALIDAAEVMDDLPADRSERGRTIGPIFKQAKFLAKTAEEVIHSIKSLVIADGDLQVSDEEYLTVRSEKHKHIDVEHAWPILKEPEVLGEQKLIELLEISKTKVEKEVKEKAGKGQKGKVAAALMDRLEKAGGITTSIVEKLELKKGTINEQSISGNAAPAGGASADATDGE